MANYETKYWKGHKINRGQFVTSNDKLSNALGLSIAQIRRALDKLKETNYIETKTTNKNTTITIVNYDTWVGIEEKTTNKKQRNNKQKTTTKENKNIKEVKEIKRECSPFDFLKLNFSNEVINIENEFKNKFSKEQWAFMIEKFNDFYFNKNVSLVKLKKWINDELNYNKTNNVDTIKRPDLKRLNEPQQLYRDKTF
ncbi:helix-turn-helix domain-containing protein [Flavobacterium haoranii]|nr:hypothetical protein [Flavobacterium haoranii]